MFHLKCPACKKINRQNKFLKSINKDRSIKNFNYLKCINCKTVFLSDKKINFLKLKKLHSLKWHAEKNFKFKETYNKNTYVNRWYKRYNKIFNKVKNKKILDVGCGDGAFCLACKKIGFKQIFGFDIKIETVNKLKNKNICFFQSDFNNFEKKLPKGIRFDYITLHDVLEHSYKPEQLILLVKKLIKPSGKIFIEIPSGEYLQIEYLKEYALTLFAPFHRTLFSMRGLSFFLKRHNLRIVKTYNLDLKTWGWTRGLSFVTKLAKYYEILRKNSKFRKLDFLIDDLFEKISINLNKGPKIFVQVKVLK